MSLPNKNKLEPGAQLVHHESANRAVSEVERRGGAQTNRIKLNLPQSAFSEAFRAANKRGWSHSQFFLFALALAVRAIEESDNGGQLLLKSGNREVRELLIPKW